ncbi:MAG: ClC family H(+)/Cl(-) exchange transporter, partial [Clostridia bacterium]|nr:ClC family H(+)/Cl(-) exchange transporter [Clostridia bacterium]
MAKKATVTKRKKYTSKFQKPECTCSEEFVMHRGKRDKLVFVCALAGILGGALSVLYRRVLTYADDLRASAFSLADTPLRIALLFAGLIILGAIVGFIVKSEPLASGSGIPQVEDQLQGRIQPRWLRVILAKFVGGALCILGGLSLGREGPSIQLSAMAAQGLAEKTTPSDIGKKYLIASGACAGLAAAFNAPLAGAMFGLEEVHKNFSKLALLSALLASILADYLSKAFFGTVSSLDMGLVGHVPFQYYALFVVVGVIMGLVGALYNKVLLATQKLYSKLPLPVWVRIIIPFIFAGVIGLFYPEILGSGHNIINGLSAGNFALGFMILLLVGKFAFSMICYGSGAPGGIFFPLLVIGALVGAVLGKVFVLLFGLDETYVINFMLLGMCGMFAGVVRAPVTGIILVLEMSGSLTQLAGLTIAAAAATMVADYLGSAPIYDSLLHVMRGSEEPIDRAREEHHIIELPINMSSPLSGVMVRD